jgi:transposase InsO family protein
MDPERENQTQQSAGSGRAAEADRTAPAERATPPAAKTKYSAQQKLAILRAYAASPSGMRDFCSQHGLTTSTLCAWRKRFDEEGEAGLEPRPNPRNKKGRSRGAYTPEQRREAVEAYATSGLLMEDFCRVWGVGRSTMSNWLKRYREGGPQGLESRRSGNRKSPPNATPEEVKEKVRETKRKNPSFGLRKVRDWLFRHEGKKVSATTVKKVLKEAELHPPPKPKKKPRKKKPIVRRFERSKPRELWQSDITSFLLPRTGRRLYLTVFLDDYSRYIVGWQLATHQRVELVIEALLEGIARFGKPQEVLTDQGRQYFAWRGKSRFQKLLHKEGIQHVVSRAHHPQTLGKTERLWATVNAELWERVRMNDLVEAKVRMGHFIQHYNHFRPHQGIDGAVPADRFFGAEDAMRQTLEGNMEHELDRALAEPKREAVYLFGRIGEKSVSLHGEGGRLIVRTEGGEEMDFDMKALGGAGSDGKETENGDEAHAIPGAEEDAARGAGALALGDGGGAGAGASASDGNPGALAGAEVEAGGGSGIGGETASDLATLADGGVRYGRGLTEAAAVGPWERGDESGGRPEATSEADFETRRGGEVDGTTAAIDPGSSAVAGGSERGKKDGHQKPEEESDEGWWRWEDFLGERSE